MPKTPKIERKWMIAAFEFWANESADGKPLPLTRVGKRFGKTPEYIRVIRQTFDWDGRLARRIEEAKKIADTEETDRIAEMLRGYRAIQTKALIEIKKLGFEKAEGAVHAYDTAVKGEQLLTGGATERTDTVLDELRRRHAEKAKAKK